MIPFLHIKLFREGLHSGLETGLCLFRHPKGRKPGLGSAAAKKKKKKGKVRIPDLSKTNQFQMGSSV